MDGGVTGQWSVETISTVDVMEIRCGRTKIWRRRGL